MASLPEEIDREMRRTIQAGFDRIYCSLLEVQWKAGDAVAAVGVACAWCGETDPVMVTGRLCDACETRARDATEGDAR